MIFRKFSFLSLILFFLVGCGGVSNSREITNVDDTNSTVKNSNSFELVTSMAENVSVYCSNSKNDKSEIIPTIEDKVLLATHIVKNSSKETKFGLIIKNSIKDTIKDRNIDCNVKDMEFLNLELSEKGIQNQEFLTFLKSKNIILPLKIATLKSSDEYNYKIDKLLNN
jgi:uncharacterized Zn ribbon protein